MILIAGFMHCSTLKVILEIIKKHICMGILFFISLQKQLLLATFSVKPVDSGMPRQGRPPLGI